MSSTVYLWPLAYFVLLLAHFGFVWAITRERKRYKFLVACVLKSSKEAYAAGWLHACAEYEIDGTRRLAD